MAANVCGLRVRAAREKLGISQVDLAAAMTIEHKVELDQSDISEIERGVRGVKDYELVAFSSVLGVGVGWLLALGDAP